MNTPAPAGRSRMRVLLLAGIYLVAALPVTFVFVTHPGLTGHPNADFGRMMDGSADRPYVTRVLVPLVVRGAVAAVPHAMRDAVAEHMRDRRMIRIFGWTDPWLVHFAVAAVVFAGCFAGFAFVLRRLSGVFYDLPAPARDLAPLLALAFLPLCFRYYSYPYDPATLLLFSLGVLLIAERRFRAFLAVLVLATLNKETSILLVGLYAWHRMTSERNGKGGPFWVPLLVWGGVRAAVGVAFAGHGGATVETHLDHTVWLFTQFPGRLWYALAVIALLALVVVPGWYRKPRFLRGGLLLTVVPLGAAALFLGFADELRGYYEAAPFVFLLALPTVTGASPVSGEARETEASVSPSV